MLFVVVSRRFLARFFYRVLFICSPHVKVRLHDAPLNVGVLKLQTSNTVCTTQQNIIPSII